ncbi:hypothetical protein N7488_003802 [Penicillium malachiteum]|nr:hypothetical protein N7488_003802 [Penicillium malachiteum]
MPSEHKRKDSLHPRHRSHKGCWTCKRKRIQCDEIRPACQQCTRKGMVCEGYEIRLRWGAGIASRGRFNGAEKPIQESIPPHSKRRWDLRGKGEQRGNDDQQGQPVLLERGMTEARSSNQPVVERATVNILNVPCGQEQDYVNINKHFELPVSMGSMIQEGDLYNEVQNVGTSSAQYGDSFSGSGRSALAIKT